MVFLEEILGTVNFAQVGSAPLSRSCSPSFYWFGLYPAGEGRVIWRRLLGGDELHRGPLLRDNPSDLGPLYTACQVCKGIVGANQQGTRRCFLRLAGKAPKALWQAWLCRQFKGPDQGVGVVSAL